MASVARVLLRNESGTALVEYSSLALLVAIAAIAWLSKPEPAPRAEPPLVNYSTAAGR